MPALVPIVEGQGEVQAVPVLVRRLIEEREAFHTTVARPVRAKRNQIVLPGELERKLAIAERDRADAAAILIILDADDDCAAELAADLGRRAAIASGLPTAVVIAVREFEAWFLGSIESLRGSRGIRHDATVHGDPEGPRAAKGALSSLMGPRRRYVGGRPGGSLREARHRASVAALQIVQEAGQRGRSPARGDLATSTPELTSGVRVCTPCRNARAAYA